MEIEDPTFDSMNKIHYLLFVSGLVIGDSFTIGKTFRFNGIRIVIFRVAVQVDLSGHRRLLAFCYW